MMLYVFDNNTLSSIIKFYYYERFPSFWERFNELMLAGEVVSAREVRNEIKNWGEETLAKWAENNPIFFEDPTIEEMQFVSEIFKVKHFQQLIGNTQRLKGSPVADPFIIAKAKVNDGIVVTMEKYKENSAKIPNICRHFDIRCMNLEEFMIEKDWKF
jgi:hypothetical protein